MGETKRLFIALPLSLPPGLRDLLDQLQGRPGLKPVKPDNTHLTLRFLGDTPVGKLELLEYAMYETVQEWQRRHNEGPLELELKGLGSFPPKGAPRVLWAGLYGPQLELLEDLANILDEWLEESGFGRADRPFKAHLTLARLRDKRSVGQVRQLIGQHHDSMFGELVLKELVLFSSQLTPQGPIYIRESQVTLDV